MINVDGKPYDGIVIKPSLDDSLCHYGVLGMKWGMRKNPEKAWAKASAKLDRLKKRAGIKAKGKITRASKRAARANKAALKASKRYIKALNNPFSSKSKITNLSIKKDKTQNKALQRQAKADKLISKGAKADKRVAKWERTMNKVLSQTEKRNNKIREKAENSLTKDILNSRKKGLNNIKVNKKTDKLVSEYVNQNIALNKIKKKKKK